MKNSIRHILNRQLPEIQHVLPHNPQPAPHNPQPAPRNPQPTTRNPHLAPRNPHLAPRTSHLATSTQQRVTSNEHLTPILRTSSIFLLSLMFLFNCVSNKKILYLQETDVKEKEYPRDSVVKTYPLQYKEYRLEPKDIISIRIGSLTPAEYNFVIEYETQLGLIRKLDQYEQNRQSGAGNQRYNQNQNFGSGDRSSGMSTLSLDRQSTGFILDKNGMLELPNLGYINFNNLSLDEAEEMLQELLIEGKLFETPVVRIQLLNFHITILGEVEQEGRYTFYDTKTTIFDAIVFGGNLTEFADRANIKVIRQKGPDAGVIYINPLDESMIEAQNYYLQPGDLIVVPPLPARYWRKYVIPDYTLALGMLSATISLVLLFTVFKN